MLDIARLGMPRRDAVRGRGGRGMFVGLSVVEQVRRMMFIEIIVPI
ncbi:MAG TPA: hypothetical protein VF933_02850 [Streptosporangiaceae bacterium]